jgi:hypothetical protein
VFRVVQQLQIRDRPVRKANGTVRREGGTIVCLFVHYFLHYFAHFFCSASGRLFCGKAGSFCFGMDIMVASFHIFGNLWNRITTFMILSGI